MPGVNPGWPATLRSGRLELRPLRRRDAAEWVRVRLDNRDWLSPWEATPPGSSAWQDWAGRHNAASFSQLLRSSRAAGRAGLSMPFAIFLDGAFRGQVNIGGVVRGAFNSGFVGYWVDSAVAGHGVTPTALAMLADHCFSAGQLHRLEANIRPENAASLRVAEKVGFRPEGLHRRYLAINGDYRDHLGHALLSEDFPAGVLSALRTSGWALPGC